MAENERALELDPQLNTVRTFLATDRLTMGRPNEARAIVGAGLAETPWNGMTAYVLGRLGDTAGSEAILKKLNALPSETWMVNTARTYAYLGLGQIDRALASLEAAAAARETTPLWIPFCDFVYDPLRHYPRFAAVVKSFGLDTRRFTSANGGRPAP